MDKITQRLLGLAAVIFALAFLIQSSSPVQADNAPQTTYGTGKYQMTMNTFLDSGGHINWYVLVWDTETGRSQMYSGGLSNGVQAATSKYNLPSSPL